MFHKSTEGNKNSVSCSDKDGRDKEFVWSEESEIEEIAGERDSDGEYDNSGRKD